MDILENNVRSECKQAFAELQTDLTDLTMELETTGIPIVPHRAYVMNVFFPGVSEHPVLLKQIPNGKMVKTVCLAFPWHSLSNWF